MKIVKLENLDGVVRLVCEGEVTQQTLGTGRDVLRDVLGPDGFSGKVLFSLQKTTYLDSSGISWLLIGHKHFVQAGGKLVIHSAPPLVDQVLRLLKMQMVLNLAADENSARELSLK
jgi:anti-anti-sigma factor